jgi:hypothetical protein
MSGDPVRISDLMMGLGPPGTLVSDRRWRTATLSSKAEQRLTDL